MPTYEYKCTECEYKFEEFQSMKAEAISVCPECSGKTERLISGGAGFLFKGNGFYITDYRSKEYKKAAEKDKPSSSTSKPSTDKKKSDSKSTSSNIKSK
jgi:putative FmdB family regulatory protein